MGLVLSNGAPDVVTSPGNKRRNLMRVSRQPRWLRWRERSHSRHTNVWNDNETWDDAQCPRWMGPSHRRRFAFWPMPGVSRQIPRCEGGTPFLSRQGKSDGVTGHAPSLFRFAAYSSAGDLLFDTMPGVQQRANPEM